MQQASIVLGLQFGDEGKGRTVDYLCSKYRNESRIVIRFSGGQQAGHTVIHNNVKHIHSNYGSGTLRGVPSYFTEHCTFYLNTLRNETQVLNDKGITPTLYIHPLAKLTTPYDVAYNRVREKTNNHGSCGLGVGTTMKRNIESPYKLYAVDLLNKNILKEKLINIKKYYQRMVAGDVNSKIWNEYLDKDSLNNEAIFFELIEEYQKYFTIKSYDFLKKYSRLIFEGSQGILLDMDHGIFPHVTYANTTSKNALEICGKLNINLIDLYYITRCYQTRHGNGPMSETEDIQLINNEEEINKFNEWQKEFRVKELDYDLINYAINVDNIYTDLKRCTKTLVITCLDQRPGFKFNRNKLNFTYDDEICFDKPNN